MTIIADILSSHSQILILGCGREGKSTYSYFRHLFPEKLIHIADENPEITGYNEFIRDNNIVFHTGDDCFMNLEVFDLIIKTPGIPLRKLNKVSKTVLTSQTDLFLQQYFHQTTGVSGTKGKSTTASLLYHLYKESGRKVLLAGNIGIPVFDLISQITSDTEIIMELSAHQGEILSRAPSTMILLNIFQEHLDHFGDFSKYKNAKLNFCYRQAAGDTYIYYADDPILKRCEKSVSGVTAVGISSTSRSAEIYFSKEEIIGPGFHLQNPSCTLKGSHNLINIAAAVTAAVIGGVTPGQASGALVTFTPLQHRLEYVGKVNDLIFYNDSISTVPEAAIAAMEALENVQYIILGGYDRGIDYSQLVEYLKERQQITALATGAAGKKISELALSAGITETRIITCNSMNECISFITESDSVQGVCLLSPAASSYDRYKNFEERGEHFKELVSTINGFTK
ncbi:MAG: UDP-N-acetylmuramoyl-L-alanine--D-glutamate ligase [Marinilabiliales bacterium]|mgnify:CR=1 FL=1|nr:MAG: UDP-N-acetylmuramoyl-L-alanine--D-glutamate ligase [Marinilabiliales bacterium]